MAKKILVACGTGICTSTTVQKKLNKALKERGKDDQVQITQCKVAEIASKADDFDLVIATTEVSAKVDTPILQGTPFLTGMGIDSAVDEIEEKLDI